MFTSIDHCSLAAHKNYHLPSVLCGSRRKRGKKRSYAENTIVNAMSMNQLSLGLPEEASRYN